MKIKWVANIYLKPRDRLTKNEYHQKIAWSFIAILKELEKTNPHALGETEKIEILRKKDSDLLIRSTEDMTKKKVI
jgi:hypothetical protein